MGSTFDESLSSIYKIKDDIIKKTMELYDKVFSKLFQKFFTKPSNIVFLGLDNAGKTTLLGKLKNNVNNIYRPTKHTVVEEVSIGNLNAKIFDVGGHKQVRFLWKDFFYNIDGVVFIVDTFDTERAHLTQEAYNLVLELAEGFPILLLMNKVDCYGYFDPEIMQPHQRSQFKLEQEEFFKIDTTRPLQYIQYLSIVLDDVETEGSLLREGFKWLGETISLKNEKSL